jgi:hypothetical protein
MISYMAVVNMIVLLLPMMTQKKSAAVKPVTMVKTAARIRIQKCPPGRLGRTGTAVKMVSAACPGMMVKIAAKHLINH